MGGAFEIGDDGIVPSTPTLQMSGRTDGFAEAVKYVVVRVLNLIQLEN